MPTRACGPESHARGPLVNRAVYRRVYQAFSTLLSGKIKNDKSFSLLVEEGGRTLTQSELRQILGLWLTQAISARSSRSAIPSLAAQSRM
jgi:hypothetical protein